MALVLVILGTALVACGPVGGAGYQSHEELIPGTGGTVTNPSTEMYKPTALLWEDQNKDGMLWSAYTYQIIGNDVAQGLLPGTDDMKNFCPNYSNMTAPEKVNFWAFLVSAIAKQASGFDPAYRRLDLRQGRDVITGGQAYTEGLLQLSYRDIRSYAFCAFDWNKDKALPVKDLARTILDPVKNLDCGIKILATQIERTKKIALSTGAFWNFLKASGTGSKIKEIQQQTTKLPFCVAP